MQITRTDIEKTKIRLVINAGENELAPIKRHVLSHFVNNVKVAGFRPGKAPLNLVEKHVDQNSYLNEFIEHAVNELFNRAVSSENIRPLARPAIKIKKFVPYSILEFEAEAEVLGEIKLANYKRLKIAKPKVSVGAKEVSAVIDSLAVKSAKRLEVDRAAKVKDEVLIDFFGKQQDGQAVPGAAGKDYPLLLGSGSFIPGFEDNLLGMKAGEYKEFQLAFPADYGVSALRSKTVIFSVTMTRVNELKIPEINDDFAKKAGPFENLAALKSDIKKQLILEKKNQAQRQYQSKLVQEITEQSAVALPERVVDEQLMEMEEEEKRNLSYRGQTWQEHLASEGINEQQHRQRQRPEAESRVKAGLVLSEIAKAEKIEVTNEELEVRLQILRGQYNDAAMRAELDKPQNRQDIAARLLTEKTIDRLVELASN